MEISHVAGRTHLAPTSGPGSKKVREIQDVNRASQTSLQKADSLTLTEEVRKLSKEKKVSSAKKREESRSTEWEDVHKKEQSGKRK